MDKLKQIITQKRTSTQSTVSLEEQTPNSHDLVNRFIAGDMVLSDEERALLWSPETRAEKHIIYQGMDNVDVLNAYRELRTKLLRKSGGSSAIILVTSAGYKTHHNSEVAFNLATSFAMDTSKSSIYVDCDPYTDDRQDLSIREFGFGLTDHLHDPQISLVDATYPSGVEHLKIIPTGGQKDTAAEYFNHPRLGGIFNEIKYSLPHVFIFIHTPPVLHYSEASILADIADMVVLVVPSKQTTQSQIFESIELLGENKVAGIIIQE
ncbi:P-loop NTPase family protein [Sessilibacter sp. MAH2]